MIAELDGEALRVAHFQRTVIVVLGFDRLLSVGCEAAQRRSTEELHRLHPGSTILHA